MRRLLSHDRGQDPRLGGPDAHPTDQRRRRRCSASVVPIPTVGNLAVNSYLIHGEQPTLIDTGITPEVPEFDVALRELIDPNEGSLDRRDARRPRPRRRP